jgi:hypothetical protein
MPRRNHDFQSIRSEGGLLPPDLLRRILDPREKLAGTRPEDYGLPQGERLNEIITQCWNRLRRHWSEFRTAASALPESEAATGLTNDKWNLPLLRELGFGILTTGAAPEIEGRTYAISRFFASTPVHLVGCGLSLDRRTAGARGAAAANPHGLAQEFLNRSQGHLWGIVSNGLRFRVLRDSQALSRQSYLEFDLEAMVDGELYADFVLVWLIAHATRFVPRDGGRPETCWLEEWTKLAEEQGTRALGDLKQGVEQALQILGQGLVGHPRNTALREALRTGQLPLSDFHGQLLRVVYRLIFLFVAEDRTIEGAPLLHPPPPSPDPADPTGYSLLATRYATARSRYAAHYSTGRLREMASRLKGSRHGDLWQQFHLVVGALSTDEQFESARQHLALPILGGFLWAPASTAAMNPVSLTGDAGAELTNADFLDVIRHLAFTRQGKMLRPVDYKNLGSEELGGVYESLLALTPQVSGDGARFTFAEFAGNERKTSGSYYTPDCLVQCLLDSALDPVVADAIKGKTGTAAEQAILALKVCDPACGSGHFLVGAAHRLARHLARVRALAQGESEPSPSLYQHALRDVIGHCLYGVDINPMAVELCRVSLWLEAMEPGKPLSFLDHHIQCGNSLLGTTPELIAQGIPDDAFKAIEGDDKKACAELRKRNKAECKDIGGLFVAEDAANAEALRSAALAVDEMPDETPEAVQQKADAFAAAQTRYDYLSAKRLADTWCAAFVIQKCFPPSPIDARFQSPDPFGITQRHIMDLAQGRSLSTELAGEIERLAGQYQFFHWHLAFADVFDKGGFDCVLGNPPWERVKLQEKEWFAERCPEIANALKAAARKRLIENLATANPALLEAFADAQRRAEGESHFLRDSGRYPLCGRGDVNLYAVFAETFRHRLASAGRFGAVLPSGIATDDTTKFYFQDLVFTRSLVSFYDFENQKLLFREVAPIVRFGLVTAGSGEMPIVRAADFAFFSHTVEDLAEDQRRFSLSPEEITLLNPNTRTCPIFRSRADAELTKAIYRRVPVLIREAQGAHPEENPWGIKFSRMFDMSNDSHLFRTREQLEEQGLVLVGNLFWRAEDLAFVPVYESKLLHQFNHRPSTFDGIPVEDRFKMKAPTVSSSTDALADADYAALPRFWVSAADAQAAGPGFAWFCAFRGMGNVMTNSRNGIFAVLPGYGVGNSAPVLLTSHRESESFLLGCLNSFASDYVIRQKIPGGNLNFFIVNQFTCLQPHGPHIQEWGRWVSHRVLELTYSAWDLEPFAQDCGYDGSPFRWDGERRFLLRCELDAAFFHLYLGSGEWRAASKEDGCPHDETPEQLAELKKHFPTPRDAVAYIMDTFPIVKRKDEAAHGTYRTKDTILEIYDEMAQVIAENAAAVATGREPTAQYQARLNPPPGPPCDANGNVIPMARWAPNNWPEHIHPPRN